MTARASAHESAGRLDSAAASPTGIVAWYAQGFADRLGDRLLLFDNTGAAPLELLRIAQRLTGDPAFEPALRERVEDLKPFRHPAFARVRGVSVLAEPTPQLALVSEHIPGERLTQILRAARAAGFRPDPGTALWLVRQLMPAITALHEMGAEIAHGALSPDRIVVTPTGDLVVTEYVFAHALDTLDAAPADLWKELGVAVRPSAGRLDHRADIEQVGLLALAVLLGRPLAANEYPSAVRSLLDEACDPLRWSLVPPLRAWMKRALVLDEPFATAREALDTLDALLPRVSGMWASRLLPQNLQMAAPPDRTALPATDRRTLEPPLTRGTTPDAAPEPFPSSEPAPELQEVETAEVTDQEPTWQPTASTDGSVDSFVPPAAPDVDPSIPDLDETVRMASPDVTAAPADPGTAVRMPSAAWRPQGLFSSELTAEPARVTDESRSDESFERQIIRRLWLLATALAAIALIEGVCLLLLLTSR